MKPSSLLPTLTHLVELKRPAMVWGAPGVGKSDVIRQVVKGLDAKYQAKHAASKVKTKYKPFELRDVRLSMLDPVDLKGFPSISPSGKQMTWLQPDFLPTEGSGILFLDEINSAPQAVQAPAYQLTQDRKLGDYTLPEGWSIVAAGNRAGDRSIVHAMSSALASRFIHLDFEINNDDWNVWAQDNDIELDVRAFMHFRPALLHSFDPATNPRSFPCPRSWQFVSDIYKSNLRPDEELELITGTIGKEACMEFAGFVRQIKDLPTVDQVLLDPEGTKMPSSPAAQHAMVTALDTKATKSNLDRIMKYISRMSVEFQTVFVRSAIRRDSTLTGTKAYMDWGIKNKSVLM